MDIWGGKLGTELLSRMNFANCVEGVIDNGLSADSHCGKKVISVIEFMDLHNDNIIVVVCADRHNETFMMNQMRQIGLEEGKTLFEYHGFIHFWLPIFAMYSWKKLYFHGIAFLTTTYCNLNCKYCLEFTAQNKRKKRFDISKMKHSLDLAFRAIDFMGLLNIAGGEAFLFQDDLVEVLQYIETHYREQIGLLYITTNGTIMPSDSLCQIMAETDITLQIDDYTGAIDDSKILIADIAKKCSAYDIDYVINKANEWINLELGNVNNSELTENQLCHYFIACQQEWIELYDNKLSNCNYNSYAVRAGLLEEHPEEIYDLEHYDPINKMELFEYGRGYSKKGYFEMCRQCGGYWGINRRRVSVAEQEKI